jgi:hypothetical protein
MNAADDARIWQGLRGHLDKLGSLAAAPPLAEVLDRRPPGRIWPAALGGLAGALGLVILVGAIVLAPRPGGAVVGRATEGPFTLEIRSAKAAYAPDESIDIRATLTYDGPAASITISHGHGSPMSFGIVEPVNGIQLSPAWEASCEPTTLARDASLSQPFAKSGAETSSSSPDPSIRAFMADPELRLPAGTWHVYVQAWFAEGVDCGSPGKQYTMRADLVIDVRPASARTVSEPTPSTAALAPTPTPALVDGLPITIDGAPVLRGDDVFTALGSAEPGQELLIGGWLASDYVLSCPALRPGEWWNPCLAVGLHEAAANGPLAFVYPGPSPTVLPTVEAGFTEPIVFAVHTHDPTCPADNLDCQVLPVIDGVAWFGAVEPVPTSFGAAPSGGLSRADAVAAARAAAEASASGSLRLVSAMAGPYGVVGPGGSDVRGDRWVWAVVFAGQFPAPDCSSGACPSEMTFLVVLDYQSGDVLIEASPA